MFSKSNSFTVSDLGTNTTTSVTGISIQAQLDGVPNSTLGVSDPTGVSVLNTEGGKDYGVVSTTVGPISTTTMSVELKFTLTDTDGDGSTGFVGQLRLLPTATVPEPATIASACSGILLCGLGYRRLRRKVV